MSIHTCRFCGKNQDIFSIEVPAEDEEGEHSEFHVCGGCWEVIAEIAKRVYHYQKIQEEKCEECNCYFVQWGWHAVSCPCSPEYEAYQAKRQAQQEEK